MLDADLGVCAPCPFDVLGRIWNRAYPENANFKTCASRILKIHTFCDLYKTKEYWKFELDI